ncbi:MAG: chorismate synthase [Caldilineaceae bacterium]
MKKTRIDGDSLGNGRGSGGAQRAGAGGRPALSKLKITHHGNAGWAQRRAVRGSGRRRAVIERLGSQNNDPIRGDGYQANSHGGLIGGITTGMPLVFRVGFKPTSTINKAQQSVRKNLAEIDFELAKGRHDPCVGVRRASRWSRVAIELMNAVLMHQSRAVDAANFQLFP